MWYDVFVLAILVVAMVRGAARGVVWQLAGIAGIVLCLVFAETISAIGSPLVSLEPPLNQWVVMFVAYLFFSFLSFGFARLIHGAIEKAELKEYNKHLGAIFGLVKGIAVCLVITFFLVTLSESTRSMLKSSRSARYAAIMMDRLHPVMPEKLRGALMTYIHDLDDPDLDLRYADHSAAPADDESQPWHPPGLEPDPQSPPTDQNANPFENMAGRPASPSDQVDAMLQRIPGLAENDWARETARSIYDATPPASRQQMLDDLQDAGPRLMVDVLQRWRSRVTTPSAGSPPANSGTGWSATGGSTQNVGYSQPSAASVATLTSAISGRLARNPQDQPAYEQYISGGLKGLPDAVSLGVLKDWQADLTAGAVDPDPETNSQSSLDERIIRQLTLQRVSVFQLSQEIQQRLMQARQ